MKILVILNGSISKKRKYKIILRDFDRVICVDGGLNNFRKICDDLNRIDYVIGDLDSADKKILNKIPNNKIIKKNNQDVTDLEFSLRFILKKFAIKEIVFFGATGGRFDQTIGNIVFLTTLPKDIMIKIISDNEEIFLVRDKINIVDKAGKTISVIPLTKTEGLTYRGMKWMLNNKSYDFGWTGGISNIIASNKASVSLRRGCVLVSVND